MSATQDLIAAALRLTALAERNTDDRDEWQHSISEVREMCARAMVAQQRAAFDEIATLRAQLAASEARAERLESALTPRKWTKQQAHVWHCTIPDVDMAFEALRITALAEGEGE